MSLYYIRSIINVREIMKVVLIGYGRMGQTIHGLCEQKGINVIATIDAEDDADSRQKAYREGDVAIEFSHPEAAFDNICDAIRVGIPVVSGTTGWLDRYQEVKDLVDQEDGAFFYASNFSIGVNIFFMINERLAQLMDRYTDYDVSVEETHHIHKKDAPSGTAKTLAESVISSLERKSDWTIEPPTTADDLYIECLREGEVYGDHIVRYESEIDTIEIGHSAHTRDGFALGAILAAQYMYNDGQKLKGLHDMRRLMGM